MEPAEPDLKKEDLSLSAGHDAGWWTKEVKKSRTAWKDYRDRSVKVIKRYRDDRDAEQKGKKRFSILYSNTETLGPAIYSQVPVPDIRRRFQDKDPVGRMAAMVLQRATQYCLESYDFDDVLESCRQDYLLPGFAVARIKYKPYIKSEPQKDAAGQPVLDEKKKPVMDEKLVYQEVLTEYVPWDRFAMSRVKKYARVWWVAFGDDLTKDEVKIQFGEKIAEDLKFAKPEEETEGEKDASDSTCRVWEVWCKRTRSRFFVAEGHPGWVVAPEKDPLRLENFFPNAKPLWSISTNDTLIPIPEYCEYQDQAIELDDLTDRIDILTTALRRRGVYDAEHAELLAMLTGRADNQFVPVNDWATLIAKGGLANVALEMPIDGIVAAIAHLEERRASVKQTIYEVTGISDIIRGASDASETATAQQIKGRWAGLRISTRQKKFAAFARDIVRMKAEIIAERFDQSTLSLMSGLQIPTQQQKQAWQMQQQQAQQQAQAAGQQAQAQQQQPPQPQQPDPEEAKFYAQPTWEEVIQVLRDDRLRGFKIDIETDSTVQPDADAEKQARTELLTGIGQFSQSMGVAVQAGYCSPALATKLIQWALRAFKAGAGVEEELDTMDQSVQMPPQVAQKEQELQQREQQVQQAEQQAKDTTHQAQLATKDAQAQGADVAHQKEIFALQQKFAADVQQVRDDFEKLAQQLITHAENTTRDIVNNMGGPPAGVTQQ